MFYGQKLQAWKASREIQTALEKLKKWNDECKEILIANFKEFADKKKTQKDLMFQLEDFLTFIMSFMKSTIYIVRSSMYAPSSDFADLSVVFFPYFHTFRFSSNFILDLARVGS